MLQWDQQAPTAKRGLFERRLAALEERGKEEVGVRAHPKRSGPGRAVSVSPLIQPRHILCAPSHLAGAERGHPEDSHPEDRACKEARVRPKVSEVLNFVPTLELLGLNSLEAPSLSLCPSFPVPEMLSLRRLRVIA